MLLVLHPLSPLFKHIRKVERYSEVPLISALEELLLPVAQKHLVERLIESASLAELKQWASFLAYRGGVICGSNCLLSSSCCISSFACELSSDGRVLTGSRRWLQYAPLTRLVDIVDLLLLMWNDG